MSRRLTLIILAATTLLTGCINVFWETRAKPYRMADVGVGWSVTTPVKMHLKDGSTVIFPGGAIFDSSRVVGQGTSYALMSAVGQPRNDVPLDSIVGIEAFEQRVLGAPTVLVSAAATAAGALTTLVILKALFGSCPTVYADTGTGPVLEAEGFSYAIAPLLEHRDIDRLRARSDSNGVIKLELRNEALETHNINQIELVAAAHATDAQVMPNQSGRIVALSGVRSASRITDRAGRDVTPLLASIDGRVFATAPATSASARVGDLDDWLDIEADDLPPGDSVAVVLRLRNSLLNTVLLYEGMLGGRDAAEWMTDGLQRLSTLAEMSRWYVATMGMRVSSGTATTRLNDVGPIAFRDVAIVLPREKRDAKRARVRLRFVADNWRIDYAAVSGEVSHPTLSTVPLARVVIPTPHNGGGPIVDTGAVTMLSQADDKYLQTLPGQRMILEFNAPPNTTATTYFIAWQGWYREWLRPEWVRQPARMTAFVPGDSAVLAAMRRWHARQAELEQRFYASPVPVR